MFAGTREFIAAGSFLPLEYLADLLFPFPKLVFLLFIFQEQKGLELSDMGFLFLGDIEEDLLQALSGGQGRLMDL